MINTETLGWLGAITYLPCSLPVAAIVAALVLPSLPAQAQQIQRCTARADMVAYLAKTYGERPVAIGLTSNGVLLEVLAHPDGRSWSVLSTALQGGVRVSCLQLAGEAFRILTVQGAAEGDPDS